MEEKVHCRMLRRTLNLAMKHNEKLNELQKRTHVEKEQWIETNGMKENPTVQWEPINGFRAEAFDIHSSSSDEEEVMLCNYRGRGRNTDILPRFPNERTACKADFVSTYGKGRARIIRDNLLHINETPQDRVSKNQDIMMVKPVPVFTKPENMYSDLWNDEDFPHLGYAAVSREKPVNSSKPSIPYNHKVNDVVTVFSDSVSCKPYSAASIKVTSRASQVPARVKDSLKSFTESSITWNHDVCATSLNDKPCSAASIVTSRTSQVPARVKDSLKSFTESSITWNQDVCATSPNDSAFQAPTSSDMLNKKDIHLSSVKTSYDEGLMGMYLNNSFASSIDLHFSSSNVTGSVLVRNELPHMQRDDHISSKDCQSLDDNINILHAHVDLSKNDNELEDNVIANSQKNYQHSTVCIKKQTSSEEKTDIMHQHFNHNLETNYKQSDVNTSSIKRENKDTSAVNKGSLERKKYKKKSSPEIILCDSYKWKVNGDFVIQVDGLPPNPDLSGLVDLIASFGTVFDQEILNHSTGSSARFKLDSGDSCDFAVESLHDSDCLYADSNCVLICYKIPL